MRANEFKSIVNYGCGKNIYQNAINMDIKQYEGVDICIAETTSNYNNLAKSDIELVICQNPYNYHIHNQKIMKYLKNGTYIVIVGHKSNKFFNYYNNANSDHIYKIIETGDCPPREFQFGIQRTSQGNPFDSEQISSQRYTILRVNRELKDRVA